MWLSPDAANLEESVAEVSWILCSNITTIHYFRIVYTLHCQISEDYVLIVGSESQHF